MNTSTPSSLMSSKVKHSWHHEAGKTLNNVTADKHTEHRPCTQTVSPSPVKAHRLR